MEIKDATTTSLADDLKELNLDKPVTKQALKVMKENAVYCYPIVLISGGSLEIELAYSENVYIWECLMTELKWPTLEAQRDQSSTNVSSTTGTRFIVELCLLIKTRT